MKTKTATIIYHSKHLKSKTQESLLQIQSRNGELSEINKDLISAFIAE